MLTALRIHRPVVVSVLTCAALASATGSALAQPADLHEHLAQRAAKVNRQDLRSPDARDAATRPFSARAHDLRHLQAGANVTTHAPLAGPPTWPAHPQPISTPITGAAQRDDGSDPSVIGLGIAASIAAAAAIAGIASRTRRIQRRRVTA